MRTLLLTTLMLATCWSPLALSTDATTPPQEMKGMTLLNTLAQARFVGRCSFILQMFQYHQASKIEGSEEFINGMLFGEAARLKVEVPVLLDNCQKQSDHLDGLMEVLAEQNQQ